MPADTCWMRSRHSLPILAAAAFSALAPAVLLTAVQGHVVYIDGWIHVACVSIGAALAAVAAVTLTVVGAKQRDGRAVVTGGAFTLMASLLLLHGLATPDVWFPQNGVVGLAGALTLPVGAAVLSLSAAPAAARPEAVRPLLWAVALAGTGIVALGLIALVFPSFVPEVPRAGSPAALVLLGISVAFFLILGARAFRTYRLTHRMADLAVAVGIVWLGAALVPALTQDYWALGWWLGHVIELVGIGLVAIPVALDLRRGSAQSRPLAGDLPAATLVLREEAFLGSHIRALLVALATSDESTEEHSRRVALRAIEVGEELGLSPESLRALVVGGLLHDIGKLAVPTSVLQKPGPLTTEEYHAVQVHPAKGDELLRSLGGFDAAVHRLVRHHHERLDGSGYPDRLRGESLPMDTRILAVCDVYDALVSPRVYRAAASHEKAMDVLRGAGHFDQECVDALERVVGRVGADSVVLRPAPGHRPSRSLRMRVAGSPGRTR